MMRTVSFLCSLTLGSLFFLSCGSSAEKENKTPTQFLLLPAEQTGLHFSNQLQLTEEMDVFRYRNYYNGGGVAIGDINNDGLPDVFLTANMKPNRLFLNKGDFRFKDISERAGIRHEMEWATGVSMADVNGDGWLDIYVCNSGDVFGGKRENELYINQQNGTFREEAQMYGLADKGFSTHAAFFDYDQDGDLDCYVLNNSFRPVSSLGMRNIRHERDSTGGDKLYRNEGNRFVDVSQEAGIFGSVIGFGLGVTVTDVNQDTWLDIYISNDFFERDYLYINQQDGTFNEELPERMGHTSQFSMGTDAADLNNDGAPEIFVTDMLPEDERRLKTMIQYEEYDLYQLRLQNDYYEQYMRNTLQLNNGQGQFVELGQYAGVEATDWSWGALLADFDNDGLKDIYVTNGIERDLINQDFINYLANEQTLMASMKSGKADFKTLVNKMSSTKLQNYLFRRSSADTFRFENVAEAWGLAQPSFSNGAAYGDLDKDGDLDLVVNNVNEAVFVYRNQAEMLSPNRALLLQFEGPEKNPFGVGASVYAYAKGQVYMQEHVPTKGFQASMDYTMLLGVGQVSELDSLRVNWGYGKTQLLRRVPVDKPLKLSIRNAEDAKARPAKAKPLFQSQPFTAQAHQENPFIDFNRERLIYHKLSEEGPALAVGDLNGDGLEDVLLGGAAGQPAQLLLQQEGGFQPLPSSALQEDKLQEDVGALFFDADADGDLDLYVLSGGNEFALEGHLLQDRFYQNTGTSTKPSFRRCAECLPSFAAMGATVQAADYDADGDLDLFVGSRAVPGKYGLPADSYLLENDGSGKFRDVTNTVAPRLRSLGMLTDARWVDVDDDDDPDLVVVGEWMPVTIFKNTGENLERLNNTPGLVGTEGWWQSLEIADLNEDGQPDFIVGNWGLNSKFQASANRPLVMYVADFDENRTLDQIFAQYRKDTLYPLALRHDLVRQLVPLKKKYTTYQAYAGQSVENVFDDGQLEKAIKKEAFQLASGIILNKGDGSYEFRPLPEAAQWAPVRSIQWADFDGDGKQELFLAGNFHGTKPEEGRYDANTGLLLRFNSDKLHFNSLSPAETGLWVPGVVNQTRLLQGANSSYLLLARNNASPLLFAYASSSRIP